jgi:hypothetical protein
MTHASLSVEQPIPLEVTKILKSWNRLFRLWWFFHYFIGVVGVVSSIVAANRPQFLVGIPPSLEILSVVAAICVVLLTFLEPKKRARGYVAAWRILHEEVGKYKYGSISNPTYLFEKIGDGEKIISNIDS